MAYSSDPETRRLQLAARWAREQQLKRAIATNDRLRMRAMQGINERLQRKSGKKGGLTLFHVPAFPAQIHGIRKRGLRPHTEKHGDWKRAVFLMPVQGIPDVSFDMGRRVVEHYGPGYPDLPRRHRAMFAVQVPRKRLRRTLPGREGAFSRVWLTGKGELLEEGDRFAREFIMGSVPRKRVVLVRRGEAKRLEQLGVRQAQLKRALRDTRLFLHGPGKP